MRATHDEDAAFQLDLYLDRLLSAGIASVDAQASGSSIEPMLAGTAGALALGAVRFHPSFRFEERLAQRLRAAALGDPSAPGVVVPFGPVTAAERPRTSRRRGGVIVGSAIASGVSLASLAGAAALVVWRRARWERLV